ncbi:hypothetical protein E1B28_007847 [Marasmius oreades]|uniref:Uncharacterized protein n=1 Tax=Marasmius oreades TaxID=181124 RepID=A0A9P7S2Q8_9AGAR|nr:uncharacterized protein E1B28_007847 [Marasmius oreades]KAG7094242.1 hypothetical protein E1B28_007847 [Marasmius oreades]
MELHQTQAQYAAYSAMAGYASPPPAAAPPPPPPGEQPSPPPDGQQPTASQGEQQNVAEAYAAYWRDVVFLCFLSLVLNVGRGDCGAQYGYDDNSPRFKE